jgi:nucleoid DNA-binding protein/Na+-transporting methylmalonyl-CoA/oxaloacetate decarboxylase gamma subunit
MNEKVNMQDLVALLAKKSNIDPKEAEAFVKECFDIMEDGLINEQLLKIRSLGTFKLSRIEATGETAAHSEIAFSPDIELSEVVNAPFASMETTEIDEDEYMKRSENMSDDDKTETAEELNEITARADYFWGTNDAQTPQPETPDAKPKPDVTEKKPKKPEITEPKPEKPKIIEKKPEPPKVIEEKPATIENKPEKPEIIETKKEEPKSKPFEIKPEEIKNTDFTKPEYPKEPFENKPVQPDYEEEPDYDELYDDDNNGNGMNKTFLWVLILVVAGLSVLAGRYFYSKNKTQETEQTSLAPAAQPESYKEQKPASETGRATDAPEAMQTQNRSETNPAVAQETQETETLQTQQPATPPARAGGQYMIQPGERLNIIALRVYGHKAFWVYIYDENRGVIGNPDIVEPGTVVNIPLAEKYGIDRNNPESVDKALELQQRYKLR